MLLKLLVTLLAGFAFASNSSNDTPTTTTSNPGGGNGSNTTTTMAPTTTTSSGNDSGNGTDLSNVDTTKAVKVSLGVTGVTVAADVDASCPKSMTFANTYAITNAVISQEACEAIAGTGKCGICKTDGKPGTGHYGCTSCATKPAITNMAKIADTTCTTFKVSTTALGNCMWQKAARRELSERLASRRRELASNVDISQEMSMTYKSNAATDALATAEKTKITTGATIKAKYEEKIAAVSQKLAAGLVPAGFPAPVSADGVAAPILQSHVGTFFGDSTLSGSALDNLTSVATAANADFANVKASLSSSAEDVTTSTTSNAATVVLSGFALLGAALMF